MQIDGIREILNTLNYTYKWLTNAHLSVDGTIGSKNMLGDGYVCAIGIEMGRIVCTLELKLCEFCELHSIHIAFA